MPILGTPDTLGNLLVTPAEAQSASAQFAALSSFEQTFLLSAATEAINSELDRILYTATYDEVHHPGRTLRIKTRQWPITSIQVLRADLLTMMQVQYATSSAVGGTIAYITTGNPGFEQAIGLQLNPRGGSSVQLLWSAYPTLQSLVDAINAVSGWTATITAQTGQSIAGIPSYPNWLTTDLNSQVGILDAFAQPANIDAFVRDIAGVPQHDSQFGSRRVQLSEVFPDSPRYPDRMFRSRWIYGAGATVSYGLVSPRYGGVRIAYTAGYTTATVPYDLKQMCIAAALFFKDRDLAPGAFKNKKIGQVSYEVADIPTTPLPPWICRGLDRHRRWEAG